MSTLNEKVQNQADYTLYYSQGACSVATQVVLNELGLHYDLIDVNHIDNFKTINPVGAVPVLMDGDTPLTEGAAILLHLLNKHANTLIPTSGKARQKAIQDILFANATMHPAYGRLFFINQHIHDEQAKQDALNSAAGLINNLWDVVESELGSRTLNNNKGLTNSQLTVSDIMLAVYSSWGAYFPVDIIQGTKTQAMISAVQNLPSYQKVIQKEALLAKS